MPPTGLSRLKMIEQGQHRSGFMVALLIFPFRVRIDDIDRLVHHATILEMNVDSYRRKEAVEKARGAGRPPTRAKFKGSS